MEKILLNILKDQIKPALGCTEPGAVAYGVSRAKELLNEDVEKLEIRVDKNIFKNGMGVYIPGTKEKGLSFASALGLIIGKSEYGLECLKDVDEEAIFKSKDILSRNIVNITVKDDERDIYIDIAASSQNNKSRVIIKGNHTNIVYESLNEKILLNNSSCDKGKEAPLRLQILDYKINDLIDLVESAPIEDLLFIKDGIDMNLEIAQSGYNNKLDAGIGMYLYENSNDYYSLAKAMTALASEARMSGFLLPVMSSAGSGNHGLVAIIPISIIGKEMNRTEEEIIRSVTLSHLITIYVKARLGALSPVCGCGVAAGTGCAAGLTYLLGGNKGQVALSINNMIAGVTGMICDGAKIGCAYKLSISVDSAKDAALMSLRNIQIPCDNGILGCTAEKTIENLAKLSNVGMNNTDSTILDIMMNKC